MTESRLDYLKGLLGEPNVTWGSETVGELLAEVERLRREIKGLESMIRGRPLPPEAERLFRAGLDSRPMPPEAERLFLAGLDSMAGGWAAKYEAERKAAEALRAEVARLRRDIAEQGGLSGGREQQDPVV